MKKAFAVVLMVVGGLLAVPAYLFMRVGTTNLGYFVAAGVTAALGALLFFLGSAIHDRAE